MLGVTSSVQASFEITKITLDKVQSIELSNEGGELLPQTVKAYVSTSISILTPEEFSALKATTVLSINSTDLPIAGSSKEFNIASFQVPQPNELCGQYFLIMTLTEGQGTTPYFQVPVSRTKDCEEDVDLKWGMEGEAKDFGLFAQYDQNVAIQGGISNLNITNEGKTDLAIRSATDAPEVMAFLASSTSWQFYSIFGNYYNNYTLEMAVNEAVNLELAGFQQNGMTNSLALEGTDSLLVDLENGRSLAIPTGATVEVRFADLKSPASVPCSYNMLVLVIDPFERTKDSDRNNNYFFAPINVGCSSDSTAVCEVMSDPKSKGREALLISWNYGNPSGYMFMEKNGKGGFSSVEYDEMKTKLKSRLMLKTHAKRLVDLGLCPEVENKAESAVNSSMVMRMLTLISTIRTSLASLTVTNNVSKSEHNKVLKTLELEEVLGTLALEKDGPVRFMLIKSLAKQIKQHVRAMLMPGSVFSQLGEQMGVDFIEILDLMEPSPHIGMGGPHGMGPPYGPYGGYGGEGQPGGMGGPYGGYGGEGQPGEMGGPNGGDGEEGQPRGMGWPTPKFPVWRGPEMGGPNITVDGPETGGSPEFPGMSGPESGDPKRGGSSMGDPGMGDSGVAGSGKNDTATPGMISPSVKPPNMGNTTAQAASCPTVVCLAYGSVDCIDAAYLCDGFRDCADGQDESNCNNTASQLGTRALHKDGQANVYNTDFQEVSHGLHGRGPPEGRPFGGRFPWPPPFPGNFSFNASLFNFTAFPPPVFNNSINGTGFVVGQNSTHFYITVNGTTYAVPVNGTPPFIGGFPGPRPHPPGGFDGPFGLGKPEGFERPGEFRPGRRPMKMYSGNFMPPGPPGHEGGHHRGHGSGRGSPLKLMMMKIFLRLASGAAAADLDELSFLDVQTRQLIIDVYDMTHESGCPNVLLPYEEVISTGAIEPVAMFTAYTGQHISPTDFTPELLVSFLDFVKNNVSVTVRDMVKDNSTLTALLDLSLLYLDVFKSHAAEVVNTVKETVQQLMMDPSEISLLMKMPGPEPTDEMYCLRRAEEEVVLKNPEIPKKKSAKFFQDPFAEILAANKAKSGKPCFWKIEDGSVFRGERSDITGTMFWEKVALCNCNNEPTYQYGPRPYYGRHGDDDDDNDDVDLFSFIFGGGRVEGQDKGPGLRNMGGRVGGWEQGQGNGGGYAWADGGDQARGP